ncbi:MAG: 2-succinyl-5-enolpyruvyl-6-hydroxy-3-cyclohexene-1-carboxylic-acid synthase, partial [Microcoleaceae cyanobacterium]
GGIFEMLPIAKYDIPLEEYFATPQNIDFSQLVQTYHINYELIEDWQVLRARLNPLPTKGVRILELKTNRHYDAQWRLENLPLFASLKS